LNFNALAALVDALTSVQVATLQTTWKQVPYRVKKALQELQEVFSKDSNYQNYRALVKRETGTPLMPCIGKPPISLLFLSFILSTTAFFSIFFDFILRLVLFSLLISSFLLLHIFDSSFSRSTPHTFPCSSLSFFTEILLKELTDVEESMGVEARKMGWRNDMVNFDGLTFIAKMLNCVKDYQRFPYNFYVIKPVRYLISNAFVLTEDEVATQASKLDKVIH
jgi:hypothetical protein